MPVEIQDQDDATFEPEVRDERGMISAEYYRQIEEAIEERDVDALLNLTQDLHEADLGDIIEALGHKDRADFLELLADDFDFVALVELGDSLRAKIVEALPNDRLAEGISELDSDDAVLILEDMEEEDRDEVLAALPALERMHIRRSLDYPEDSAGRLMQTSFIAVAPFWTVGQTIDYMRETPDLPDVFHQIFVIDPGFRLLGDVSLDTLLRSQRSTKISSIQHDERHYVEATQDQEEVSRLFERYDLLSAAVLDEGERLVGVITIDDIVDVIHEEADEDIKRLGGVGDEEITDTVLDTMKSRFTWLSVNLLTAIIASWVIAIFDTTIQQMVALAVLMPIVASMGGNAATQTMTVAVRALATQELDSFNVLRVVGREVTVAVLNGFAFALILGVIAAVWFGNYQLGFVIGTALVVNLFCAGLSGILIPIGLNKAGADPAIASSVFITTVTDVVGFFAFLGLAGWWFGLA
ncbi:magnesium transporter [uncultured Cohaesibacter sp.]|uniref:magnesium transporter n=1 Tax=uncultured Cohaesibacter sp. TaxID=1002546 RepID=UPI0029C8E8C5|nr:magnesium transporter [uncultured Cohaesibacter sp.]